jgi:hypothetical protein
MMIDEEEIAYDPDSLVQDMFNDFASSTALALALFAVNSAQGGDHETLKGRAEDVLSIWKNGAEHIIESVKMSEDDRKVVMKSIEEMVERTMKSWGNVWGHSKGKDALDG